MACTCDVSSATNMSARTFTSVVLPRHLTMTGAAAAAVDPNVIVTHHASAFGDSLVSTQNPNSGTIDIKGNLGFIDVDLSIGIKLAGNAVTVSITVQEPVKLGPAQWVFDISGSTLTRQTTSSATLPTAAAAAATNPPTSALMALSVDWSCILKCGGDKIMPILTSCLGSILAGGPQAFVACVLAALAGSAGDIATCIVTSCL